MKNIRLYILAPLLAIVISALTLRTFIGITEGWNLYFLSLIYGAIVASYYVVVLALPTFLVLWHLGIANLWTSITAGFVIGCIPTAYVFEDWELALFTGASGAIGGWVFWLVVRRDIEDTLAEPPTAQAANRPSATNNIRLYILAPVLAIAIPTLMISTFAGIDSGRHWFVIFLFLGTMFAGFHVLVLALPTFLVFWYLGIVNMWTSVIAGFVIGCIPAAWMAGKVNVGALMMGACGAIGGWVFWLVISRIKGEGFVIGCVPTAILPTSVILFNADIAAALEMGVLGAIGGLVFWLVIRRAKDEALVEPQVDPAP